MIEFYKPFLLIINNPLNNKLNIKNKDKGYFNWINKMYKNSTNKTLY